MILSYILHGNIPTYNTNAAHPDSILHGKLKKNTSLTELDVDHLTEHFLGSRYSYSTQALPVNVLLDALIRPYGETEGTDTCITWRHDPSLAVSHAVIGHTKDAGGQWVDNPVQASLDIGTLSYAEMLSLPGYTFAQHYRKHHGQPLPFYLRPTRREVASYFAEYPQQAGISDTIYNGLTLSGIVREGSGFYVASHGIRCQHLVLATGIFSEMIPPRPLLKPLAALPFLPPKPTDLPLLVIGSGFSAADVIISANPAQKLIHIFKWDPANHPSPLRACHSHSYPEYAGVYKRMKLSAISATASPNKRPKPHRSRSSAFDLNRNWDLTYDGLPNTEVTAVEMQDGDRAALLTLKTKAGETLQRRIAGLAYVVGRRGSINYLNSDLKHELIPGVPCSINGSSDLVSGSTFREKAHDDMEVAKNIFIIGSLTGDSLIRFSYGSCAYTAGKIIKRSRDELQRVNSNSASSSTDGLTSKRSSRASPLIPAMNGLDGHGSPLARPITNESEVAEKE